MQVAAIAERVARNQATFRHANERIEVSANEIFSDATSLSIPFICECPDESCRLLVQMELEEYEMVRSRPEWFLAAPGHEVCTVDGQEVAFTAERYERFSVMEKIGEAGELARQLDARS